MKLDVSLPLEIARSIATRWMMEVGVELEGRGNELVILKNIFCLVSLTKQSTLVVGGDEVAGNKHLLLG